MKPFWIWRSFPVATHEIGTQRITPVVQAIGLRWPGGGWLWQFPLAVEVENEQEDATTRLPIPDLTRTVVWFLAALSLVIVLTTALAVAQRRRASPKHKKG